MTIRTSLRILLCAVLVISLASDSEAARRKRKKDPVIITPPTLVERAQAIRNSLQADLQKAPLDMRVKTALRLGMLDENSDDLKALENLDKSLALEARVQLYLKTYRFSDAAKTYLLSSLALPKPDDALLHYKLAFIAEDLAGVDTGSRFALSHDSADVPALWARGELMLRLLRFSESRAYFEKARTLADNEAWKARAILGLGKLLYKEDKYQQSFDTLCTLMDSVSLDDEVLFNMGLALIGLSRINEAIELFEEAARWNPSNEFAQYYLGNGYCRQSYTQLHGKNGISEFFPGDAALLQSDARRLLAAGDAAQAAQIARNIADQYPEDVESRALLGSIFWQQEQLDSAAACFRDALAILPGYGRARNGLAKALEGMRLRQNVHRAADSLAFARTPMPDVPRIGEFVINWTSLSPRHQKQVALSIAPWKVYLPVLIESGSRYYIKPLHELLSECPNLEPMRDQRIEYDSRLWDDVRGCGGFTTVTGIEDVERSIFGNYNTVLHELTHQVHGVFPETDANRILDWFHAARIREDGGQPTFMSRYQQASVWEYFAEGANALFSPRRDAYDTREVVRERLMERDTSLAAAVHYYITGPNLPACYPVGLVNAAENALGKQETANALLFANRAFAREPHGEAVLSELVRIHSILDEDSLALAFADTFLAVRPQRAAAYIGKATARFFHDGNDSARIEILTRALTVVDSTERNSVRLALGEALWYAGRYHDAAQQYRGILAEVRDDPKALWGLGLALGDAGDIPGADSAFRQALALRSGLVDLRLDYARILLQAGRLDEAGAQLEEAQLLARGDPILIALKGWYTSLSGNNKEALRLLDRAVELAPEHRLSWILRLDVRSHYTPPRRRDPLKRDPPKKEAEKLLALSQTDIPVWIFQERIAAHVPAKIWPHYQRELLRQIAGRL